MLDKSFQKHVLSLPNVNIVSSRNRYFEVNQALFIICENNDETGIAIH